MIRLLSQESPHRNSKIMKLKLKIKEIKVAQSDSIVSSSGSSDGHCLEEFMICTSCWQSDSKRTCLKPHPLSSSIAQTRPSASTWSGEEELMRLVCPRIISVSPSNRVNPKPLQYLVMSMTHQTRII